MRKIGKNNRPKSRQPGLRGKPLVSGLNANLDQNFRKDRGDPNGSPHFYGFLNFGRKTTLNHHKPSKFIEKSQK